MSSKKKSNPILTCALVAGLASAGAAGGCGDSGSGSGTGASGVGGETSTAGSPGTGGTAGNAGTGGDPCFGCGAGGEGQGGAVNTMAINVSPATAELTVENGVITTQSFTVTTSEGVDITNNVTWVFERPDVGDIVGAGVFTPTGLVGGLGKLTASYQALEGSANVSVTISKVVNTAGVDDATMDAFDSPVGPDPALSIVYPYNEVVFPLDVLPPEVQWNGAAGNELYRFRLSEKYYTYTEFVSAPGNRHIISADDWQAFSSSGSGAKTDPVTFELSRQTGGGVLSSEQTWHVALGKLKGSIYYWELPGGAACDVPPSGRVLRIKPSATEVEEFYQPGEGTCWGCHTVSRDGKKMMATLDTSLPFPQVTIDLSTDPATQSTIGPGVSGGTFSAFNDEGDRIVVSNDSASSPANARLRVIDGTSGAELNPNAMGNGCGEPAWSPDGTKMAAICGLGGGGWIFDAPIGYLAVADVADDGFTVTNTQSIVPQDAGPGRPAYPSFSPGSEWIAFGRTTQGSRTTGQGSLWMTRPDGTDTIELANAGPEDRSFNPVFAPLRAGGYFWLVFSSRRDYGNRLVNTNRQQLWITAVEDLPTAGVDPSSPAFYIRGQVDCALSENAYYALDPCKEDGESCTSGVDCCNGTCVRDPETNEYVCGEPPPPGECVENGNACKISADCCDPTADCVDGFCALPIPE